MSAPFAATKPKIGHSACPHDCPSTCANSARAAADLGIGDGALVRLGKRAAM